MRQHHWLGTSADVTGPTLRPGGAVRYTRHSVSLTAADLVRGSRRLGRYELLARIARGGMGEIYLARASGVQGFEKLVVIKQMLPQFNDNAPIEKLFFNEARIAAMLSHPNVCHVYELDRDGETYYMAMEYLQGIDVAEMLRFQAKCGERLAIGLSAALVVQACAGLQHAHELRDDHERPLDLVHRDISPANLFVTTNGIVKVLDFGIAKLHASAPNRETSQVKGKFAYMSPEQLRGDRLDRRADVFSLGVVLWELLVGTRLFKRQSEGMTVKAVLDEDIPRADSRMPSLPSSLADVVACALERDLDKRFASANAFATALTAAVSSSSEAPWNPTQLAGWVKSSFHADLAAQRRLRMRATSGVLAVVDPTEEDPSLEIEYGGTHDSVSVADSESESAGFASRTAVTTPMRALPGQATTAPSAITADIVTSGEASTASERARDNSAPKYRALATAGPRLRKPAIAALLLLLGSGGVFAVFMATRSNSRATTSPDNPRETARATTSQTDAPTPLGDSRISAVDGANTDANTDPSGKSNEAAADPFAIASSKGADAFAGTERKDASENPPLGHGIQARKKRSATRTKSKPRTKRAGKLYFGVVGDYANIAVRASGSRRWQKLGDTPILGAKLLEGTYTLVATSPTGRKKTLRIRIKPRASTRKTIKW